MKKLLALNETSSDASGLQLVHFCPHRSVDGQRNDRLGRAGQFRQQFEHRWQILRAICFADAYSNRKSNRDSDSNADRNTHRYINAHCDCHSNTCFAAETFTDGETGVNAEAAPHAATVP